MFSTRLSLLAVSAKLLCLLMVVMCDVAAVKLYSKSSKSFVRINGSGQVHAIKNLDDKFMNLTLSPIDDAFNLNIYCEISERFICFTPNWKLIGVPKDRLPPNASRCQFTEVEEHGYNRYRSVANDTYYLAFNSKGKPIRHYHKQKPRMFYPGDSQDFLVLKEKDDISEHNLRKSANYHKKRDMVKKNYPNYVYQFNDRLSTRHHKKRHKHRGK